MKTEVKGALLVVLAGICWGIVGIITRGLAAYGITALANVFLSSAVAALILFFIILKKDARLLCIRPKDGWLFIGTGICSVAFFKVCYFKAVEVMSMSLAAVLLYTAPCFVVLLSAVFFGERITAKKTVALVLAFIGCFLSAGIIGSGAVLSLEGFLLGIGAGAGYGLYSIFGKVALRKYGSLTVTFYTFLVSALALAYFADIGTILRCCAREAGAPVLILLLGTVSTLLPFLSYTKALEYIEAGKASIMAFIEPLVATICGMAVFHEPLTVPGACGIGLFFVSLVLLNTGKKEQEMAQRA